MVMGRKIIFRCFCIQSHNFTQNVYVHLQKFCFFSLETLRYLAKSIVFPCEFSLFPENRTSLRFQICILTHKFCFLLKNIAFPCKRLYSLTKLLPYPGKVWVRLQKFCFSLKIFPYASKKNCISLGNVTFLRKSIVFLRNFVSLLEFCTSLNNVAFACNFCERKLVLQAKVLK